MLLYNSQTSVPVFINLLRTILAHASSKVADVEALFKLASIPQLQEIAIRNLEAASTMRHQGFEPHISELFDLVYSEAPEKARLSGLVIIANLCIKEAMRSKILEVGGFETLIAIIRGEGVLFKKVEAQRTAAKGLSNLVATRRELRLKAITDLGAEIK